MNSEIFARTAKLLAGHMGYDRSKIAPKTSLQIDTGMDGLDAEEFLYAYAEEFGVDMAAYRMTGISGRKAIHPSCRSGTCSRDAAPHPGCRSRSATLYVPPRPASGSSRMARSTRTRH